MQDEIRIGTRGSRMARIQAAQVQQTLCARYPHLHFRLVTIHARGDIQADRPLREFVRPGIFTSALEQALHAGRIHLAVHSFKDLPADMHRDCVIGAVLPRGDPADALVTRGHAGLADLAAGARIGTSSPRRARMLASLDRGFHPVPIRGNIDTRIRRLDEGRDWDALVVAACGLDRLDLADRIAHRFDLRQHLTAPAQGALAVQCMAGAQEIRALIAPLDHMPTRYCTEAERSVLAYLGGGCALALAAWGQMTDGLIHLDAGLLSYDGREAIRCTARGHQPATVGRELARKLRQAGCLTLL